MTFSRPSVFFGQVLSLYWPHVLRMRQTCVLSSTSAGIFHMFCRVQIPGFEEMPLPGVVSGILENITTGTYFIAVLVVDVDKSF